MSSFEIFYKDLNDEAQYRFNEQFGNPENFNHNICPLGIYEQEGEKDTPDEGYCGGCRHFGKAGCPGKIQECFEP